MPRRDGTGPENMGPLTGRGLGNCDSTGSRTTGQATGSGLGRGLFAGRGGGGRGRGFFPRGRGFYNPAQTSLPEENIQEEITFLEQRLNQLKSFLKKD